MTGHYDTEARTLRDRHADAADELDNAAPPGDEGAAAIVCQTVQVTTYPTTASAYYGAQSGNLQGDESEGATATFVSDASPVFYAWNAGTQVPPQGTTVVVHAVGGRWVFRWDG